jgi:hypothetical protein
MVEFLDMLIKMRQIKPFDTFKIMSSIHTLQIYLMATLVAMEFSIWLGINDNRQGSLPKRFLFAVPFSQRSPSVAHQGEEALGAFRPKLLFARPVPISW